MKKTMAKLVGFVAVPVFAVLALTAGTTLLSLDYALVGATVWALAKMVGSDE